MKKLNHLMAWLILLCCAAALCACSKEKAAEESLDLRFHNGKFRIAQLTDIHWGDETSDTVLNAMLIETVANEQKPDLFVLTGDIVTSGDARKGWQRLLGILETTRIPYAVCMGHHDGEAQPGCPAGSVLGWLRRWGKHCISLHPIPNIHGFNSAIPVLGESDDSVRNVIYCIDSNSYPADSALLRYSDYDWIQPDQIEWYVAESRKFATANGGKPVPSLAYFHICVPEFMEIVKDPLTYGTYGETCCPPSVNSGFFARAFMQKDIMGMFVGHDHSNDFVGQRAGICLAYGRQSGVMANSPSAPMGTRIVELTEGRRAFRTWIVTLQGEEPAYHYPMGYRDGQCREVLPSIPFEPRKQGVAYTMYSDPTAKDVQTMLERGVTVGHGTWSNIDRWAKVPEDHFGLAFQTMLRIDEAAPYRFTLTSDDGSKLYIDDQLIVDNDGSHSVCERSGFVRLAKGFHRMRLEYFEDTMGSTLSLKYCTPNMDERRVPDAMLYQPE